MLQMSCTTGPTTLQQRSKALQPGMDKSYVSKDLLDTFAGLEPPQVSKFSESDLLLNKVLRDKNKKEKAAKHKRARAEADKLVEATKEESEDEADHAAAKKAKYEESRPAMQRQIKAQAGPPVFRQALFPVKGTDAELKEKESREFADVCKGLLGEHCSIVDGPTLARELLLDDCLPHILKGLDATPACVAQVLFKLATRSHDIEAARKAYEVLASLLGGVQLSKQLLGRQQAVPAGSGLYQDRQHQQPNVKIDDLAYAAAFAALGYRNPDAPGQLSVKASKPSKPETLETPTAVRAADQGTTRAAFPGWEDVTHLPSLQNLQLLLRLLVKSCKHQADGNSNALSGGGLQQLLLTVLNLRMDPACNVLAIDLEAAAAALLDAFSEADWVRKFTDLAAQTSALGGSHRGGVEVIRLLPSDSGRAELLRSHAAVHLLSSLLLPKDTKPPAPAKSRSLPGPVDPEAAVHAQAWFEGGEGFLRLAKKIKLNLLSIWELHSAIELVDILLWPFVKASKEDGEENRYGAFISKWHNFCQKIGNHMNKDDQGAALKLLITTIITRDNPGTF